MARKRTPGDFKFVKQIGEGSFSLVYLAVDSQVSDQQIREHFDLHSGGSRVEEEHTPIYPNQHDPKRPELSYLRKYAIKVCQKAHLQRQGRQYTRAIMREKEILNMLNERPNKHFVKLFYTFQDVYRLYFVMNYAENGDLLALIQGKSPLSLDIIRKYTLQLITALEHMHYLGIIHRDLKPENVLLNSEMNILLSDFGSAKIYRRVETPEDEASGDRKNSFVGTAQYVSPEMLKNRMASNKSDLWSMSIIVFQMLTNELPFGGPNEYMIYQKIQNCDYSYPFEVDSDCRDLIDSILQLDPEDRLGAKDDIYNGGYLSLRSHAFLRDVDDSKVQFVEPIERVRIPLDAEILNNLKPGLDENHLLKLLTLG